MSSLTVRSSADGATETEGLMHLINSLAYAHNLVRPVMSKISYGPEFHDFAIDVADFRHLLRELNNE